MENKKKILWESLFLVLVFGGTVYGVFHGEDIGKNIQIIKETKKIFMIPAIMCVILFIWGESLIIYYMTNSMNIQLKKWTCFLFSSVGFFFSCITPSASGGQPAQIYYMKRKKVPVPVSTVVLMVVTITYKAVLVIAGIGMLILGQKFIHQYLDDILPVFYLGIALNVICVGFMILLVFDTKLAKSLICQMLSIFEKLHIVRYKQSRHEKLEYGMTKYQETAVYFKNHKHVVVHVLMITFLQRFMLFLSTYFVYKAFELDGTSLMTIVMLQAAISISVDMLPLPGGMGISEKLFMTIFVPVFTSDLLLPGMILSRGISYYTQLLLCAALTLTAHFTIGRKSKIKRELV